MARTRIGRWGAVGMAAVLLLFGLQVIRLIRLVGRFRYSNAASARK